MISKKKYTQDESSNSESSSDEENQFTKQEFSGKDLSKIANNLLEEWVYILMELDVSIIEIKHIESLYPRDMRRQAIEGLTLWQRRSLAPMKDILKVLRNNNRQDMIELIEEMQESPKKSVRRKRSLHHSYSGLPTVKRRAIHVKQCSSFLSICEETKSVSDTDMNLQTDSEPSTSIQRQADEAEDESKLVKRRTAVKKLNMTTMTVEVLEMSPIKHYGNYICKERLGILLHSDEHLQNIRASAFGKNVKYINQSMKPGMLYNISGYELRTSEYVRSEQELILSRSTIIEHISKEERFEETKYESQKIMKIADIKNKTLVRTLHTVGPVIITSIGPAHKRHKKFLKEVMLKDKSGKIKMNIWGFRINDIQFWYKRGEVLKLKNVEVGMFKAYDGDTFYLTAGDFATFEKKSSEKMQRLLKHEDEHYLIPETMDIKDVVNLERSKHLIYITSVKIESFAKKSHVEMIIKHCEYEESHGMLKETDDGWYCEECQECQEGEDKVRLKAEFVDFPISSDTSLWVTLFDKSSQTILGNKYESFRQSNNAKKRRAILQKIEKQETVYRLEITFNTEFEFQTATKIEIMPKK